MKIFITFYPKNWFIVQQHAQLFSFLIPACTLIGRKKNILKVQLNEKDVGLFFEGPRKFENTSIKSGNRQ